MSKMDNNLKVLTLTDEHKKTVIREWNKFDDVNDEAIKRVQDDMLDGNWFGVQDTNNLIIAVFDIRSVPATSPIHHKSMRIHFMPDFALNNGQDLQDIETNLQKIITVLGCAFSYLIDSAQETRDKLIKIYSEHPYNLSIFRDFAKNLFSEYPEQYQGKIYGNWVEIQHKQ